ncbi:MAG: efflux transporter outer membrane subunit [Chitinophagaceae bacterium]
MKFSFRIIVGMLALSLLVSSCRLGKEYQRPTVETPAAFPGSDGVDSSSLADLSWKEFFKDPLLQNLIDSGLRFNQDWLVALNRMAIAERQMIQGRRLQLPEASLNVTGNISRPSDNSLNGISLNQFLGQSYLENYNAALNISWEADIWGKLRGQKQNAMLGYLQSAEAVRAFQTRLVADIAQAYFNLLMLDEQLAISRNNLTLTDSFYRATQMLMEAGLTHSLAVQQAAAQREATAALIPELEAAIAVQENSLQWLTGALPGTVTRAGQSTYLATDQELKAGLPAALLARRPDVRSAELSLRMANNEVGIAQANMYPALNITAGAGLESFKASNWFSIPNSLFGLAAGGLVQPLFKRRALRTQFEIAKLEREQAVIRFRQSVLQATMEVYNALVQVEKLADQQSRISAQADTLRRAVGSAQYLFRSDMASYLDVITAQSGALQAELNRASIRQRQNAAVIELYRALGGGWENE